MTIRNAKQFLENPCSEAIDDSSEPTLEVDLTPWDLLRQVVEQFHGTVSFISTQIRVGPTLDSSWTAIKVSPHFAPAFKV